jgi:hypothetical protein
MPRQPFNNGSSTKTTKKALPLPSSTVSLTGLHHDNPSTTDNTKKQHQTSAATAAATTTSVPSYSFNAHRTSQWQIMQSVFCHSLNLLGHYVDSGIDDSITNIIHNTQQQQHQL